MKVTIIHPVQHDTKALAPGQSVDLPKDAAEALIACGAAEAGSDAKAAAKVAAEAAAKAQAIADAEQAVAVATTQLEAAVGDEAKAAAQAVLDAAQADLAKVKG